VTEARYGTGSAGQQDVLKSRVEAGRLAETAVDLTERRRGTLARLNALLDRRSDSPVEYPMIPRRIASAAVADSAADVRFVSAALGARAAGSALPGVEQLEALALRESPMLREADAMVAAQQARSELARRASLPDLDISVQYGQRSGSSDMVSATVAIPLPLQKRRKQDAQLADMRSELGAVEAERHARRNEISAEVARLHSALERDRAQLALYVKSIIPQGRGSLTAATSSYQAGRVELLTLLDNQATLFSYEMEYFRLLAEFATTLAELERVVGTEILP
jgi:outer membrane protein TolC